MRHEGRVKERGDELSGCGGCPPAPLILRGVSIEAPRTHDHLVDEGVLCGHLGVAPSKQRLDVHV